MKFFAAITKGSVGSKAVFPWEPGVPKRWLFICATDRILFVDWTCLKLSITAVFVVLMSEDGFSPG